MYLNKKYFEIKKTINNAPLILIMGHKDLDLDALGSSIGIYNLINKKNCYIVVDDKVHELGVSKILKNIQKSIKITTTTEIINKVDKKTVIVVVDTNKLSLVQNHEVFKMTNNVIVIDHHDIGTEFIDSKISIVNTNASSVCEMITIFMAKNKIKVNTDIGLCLMAGIVLDTNNFVLKTTEKTYFAAYYLSKNGVLNRDVQYLLKQDLMDYIERQNVITSVKIKNNIAISSGDINIKYRREDLAKVADTLVMFNNINASVVIGNLKNGYIGVSARSLGEINVGVLLETIGGGGSAHEAAAKIKDKSLDEVVQMINDIFK